MRTKYVEFAILVALVALGVWAYLELLRVWQSER